MTTFKPLLGLALGLSLAAAPYASIAAEEVNLYSARIESLIKPLLDDFTEETGIEVNLVTGKADELLSRLKSEGRNSPADILLTTDAGRLHRAQTNNVSAAFETDLLNERVPAAYRDPEGHWYGLSLRARPVMYVKGKVDPDTIKSYADLADSRWKNQICIRSSSNIYNQSLVASMIAANGEQATEEWATGLVDNMARPPRGGDRDQIKAAAAGICKIAIANTYYLAGMLTSDDPAEREAAEKMGIIWPNQADRGTHINVSGVALTRSAKNRENAIKLIEFLTRDSSQRWYAEHNGEYPIRDDIAVSDVLKPWGKFKADNLNMAKLGENNSRALRLMDRAGWK